MSNKNSIAFFISLLLAVQLLIENTVWIYAVTMATWLSVVICVFICALVWVIKWDILTKSQGYAHFYMQIHWIKQQNHSGVRQQVDKHFKAAFGAESMKSVVKPSMNCHLKIIKF